MATTPNLPAGETLPQYDDQHAEGIDVEAIISKVISDGRIGWGMTRTPEQRAIVTAVIRAIQAVGDATFVKNGTYRLMRRDGADIERLAALLSRVAPLTLVECGGNPVDTVVVLTKADG